MLQPFKVDGFSGLNLQVDVSEGGPARCLDMLNVDLRKVGKLATRGGLTQVDNDTGTTAYHRIEPWSEERLALCRNTGSALRVERLTLSTGVITAEGLTWGTSATRATSSVPFSVKKGGGGLQLVFTASRTGDTNETLRTGGAVSAADGAPRYIAGPWLNRYVAAHYSSAAGTPSGANGSVSTVFFTDAGGIAFAWTSSNWLQLTPNDSEEITGVVVWRNLCFVAKESRLFVFYGISTDTTSGAVFNYREVSLPSRLRLTTNQGGENMIAANDGVYLFCQDGMYRTAGDVPQIVSPPVTPLFDGTGPTAMLLPSTGDWSIGYGANRVFVSYENGSTKRLLVYDILLNEWLLWDLSVGSGSMATNVIEWVNSSGTPTVYVAAGAKVYRLTDTGTTDDGTAIPWSYQSGWYDVSGQDFESTTRYSKLRGTGTVSLELLNDYRTTGWSGAQSVTLGTAPTSAEGHAASQGQGVLYSHKLSGTGAGTVDSLTHLVSHVRTTGLRRA